MNKLELSNVDEVLALPWEYIKSGKLPSRKHKVAGVYILREPFNNKIIYIGQSCNIGYRLMCHHHPELRNPNRYNLYILKVDNLEQRLYIEARSIYFLHPIINKRNGIGLKLSDQDLNWAYNELFNYEIQSLR